MMEAYFPFNSPLSQLLHFFQSPTLHHQSFKQIINRCVIAFDPGNAIFATV
jgi:hypothetical protein